MFLILETFASFSLFFFWPHQVACGILVPRPVIPLQWKHGVRTTEPQENPFPQLTRTLTSSFPASKSTPSYLLHWFLSLLTFRCWSSRAQSLVFVSLLSVVERSPEYSLNARLVHLITYCTVGLHLKYYISKTEYLIFFPLNSHLGLPISEWSLFFQVLKWRTLESFLIPHPNNQIPMCSPL